MARGTFSTILMSDFNSCRQPIAISLLRAFFTVFYIQSAFYTQSAVRVFMPSPPFIPGLQSAFQTWSSFYTRSAVRSPLFAVSSTLFLLTNFRICCVKKDDNNKKWREVCLAKLLLKFTILQFKEALRLAVLYILYLNIKKRLFRGPFCSKVE